MKFKKTSLFLAVLLISLVMTISIPANPVIAAGLTLNPASGPYNTYVTISGTAFANSTAFSVQFGTGSTYAQTIAQGVTTSTGTFSVDFWIPNYPGGTYTITATAGTTSATTAFTITSTFAADKSSGTVGDTVTLTGQGFLASRNITAYFDSAIAGTTSSDTAGSFSFGIKVPDAYRGNHTLRVADTSGYSATTLSFSVNPGIAVSPANVVSGSQVSVSGKGFTASSPVSFTLDSANLGTSANTNASGSFSAIAVTIPAVSAGNHTLKVTDGSGASATATLSTSNSMIIFPDTGPLGTKVTVQGKGYQANSQIAVTFNGAAITSSPIAISTDAAGNFTATFSSPTLPAGTYTVVAKDSVNSATANFVCTSTFTSEISKGQVGTSVPLSGTGFKAVATVSIKFDNIQIATATVDGSGTFNTSFMVPASRSGNHTITATDGINSDTFAFMVNPIVQITPAGGNVGTDIVIKGYSFNGSSTVAIKYDNNQVTTAAPDLNGSFSASFPAPISRGGNHVITVSDGITSLTSNFAMESTAPPAPKMVSPAKDIRADALAQFQWEPVNDPSGITYSLQVARDAGFNTLVINKTGMTATNYQTIETEKLKSSGKNSPYYWRVRATDGASNEGSWSTPQTFVVGFMMPNWAWYVIYAAAAIVIFVLGLFAGRMTVRSRT